MYEKLNDYQKKLFDDWVSKVEFGRMGKKTTACLITLENGFEIVGTSACVNPEDFNPEIGKYYALVDALNKLDEHVGFYRQVELFKAKKEGSKDA
jgi:hypothetical protein